MNDTLYHHGILGQKWGVRRFQNEDGSLTPAGEKRYGANIDGAQNKLQIAKKQYDSARKQYTLRPTETSLKAYRKTMGRYEVAKSNLKNEKIKERLNKEKNKSKHGLKLEEYYRKKGMSDEEAAIAAYKRAKTEKIIGITAGLTVASAAVFVAHKHYKNSVDGFIKEGTVLSRVTTDGDSSVHDAFYASLKKSDNSKYVGTYGTQLRERGNDVFQKKINVNKGIKVASNKNALKSLRQLSENDTSFNDNLKSELSKLQSSMSVHNSTPKQRNAVNKAIKSLNAGKTDQNVLNALNYNLVSRTDSTKKFYNQLNKNGYGAIQDINDQKLSGFGTKMPYVVFNSDVSVSSVRKLGLDEIQKEYSKNVLKMKYKSMAPQIAVGAAAIAGISGFNGLTKKKNNDRIVEDYRKKHPDSKMSYNDILLNYYQ